MKKLELLGETCFITGNTYHKAAAVLDGKTIAKVDFEYGYGEQWLYNLCNELSKVSESIGLPSNQIRGDSHPLQPWQYINRLESHGFNVFTNCTEVKRKKDFSL